GKVNQAIDQLRKSNTLLGEVPFSVGDLGYALAVTGHSDEAESILADLMRKREKGFYPAAPIAQIHLGLGHTDAALDWLERAADERRVGYYMPAADPIYDPIRAQPRFQSLIKRMHLG